LSGCLLRLPFYYEITEDEQERVVAAIKAFFQDSAARSTKQGDPDWLRQLLPVSE
jgi:Mlc titration factor MtfA (ptsG expression regulator)